MAEPKRMRRPPEEARRLILEAAQARLASTGPDGLRLQDIARDAGISHPTILHHFGSREGLVRALVQQAVNELKDKLLGTIATSGASTEAELDQVFEAFRGGLAQRLAWLATFGGTGEHAENHHVMRDIVDTIQTRREAAAPPGAAVNRDDADFLVHLVATAAFGDAMFGPQLRRSAGHIPDAAIERRYRAWLAVLVRRMFGAPGGAI